MLVVVSTSVCSPVLEEPTPLVSTVVVDDVVIPEGEMVGPSDVVSDVIQPPPGFPPFSWPIGSGHVAIKQSDSSLGEGDSPDALVGHLEVEPPFSPIAQTQDLESVGSLVVDLLVDVGMDSVTDVNRPVSPLPTIENLFVQDRLWAPVAVPSSDVGDRRENPVPGWRLAREGPLLAERSPESIEGWLRFPEYIISQLGLRRAFRGVWPACASSTVHRVDRGSTVRLPSGDGRRSVGGPSVM